VKGVRKWLLVGVALLAAGCAHSRYKASYEQLCLLETPSKGPEYCAAWADVEAHKLVSGERGRHTTAVILPTF
jgi:hypothetical protein